MDAHVQKANFDEAFSMDSVDVEDVKKIFLTFDWDKELRLSKELQDAREQNCPVNLFVTSDENILQLCIYDSDSSYDKYGYEAFFHYKKCSKILGLIPIVSDRMESLSVNSQSKALKMIEKFCDKNMNYFFEMIEQQKMDNRYR